MEPLKFKPIFMERIWGGTALKERFGFNIPEGEKIGELWTVSDNRTAVSVIDGGEFDGKKISDVALEFAESLYGKGKRYERFPLLIKIIDAQDKLSVQVHPDDDYARKHENGDLGKTEMWYIIDAKPGAKLVCGLKEGTTKEEFIKLLKEERLEECLKEVEVKAGDVVYIPAGMVHAIGEGILICEIQQNSDLTYRVYDYNRVDEKGRKRELHIEKALDVINFELKSDKIVPVFEKVKGGSIAKAVESQYFNVHIVHLEGQMEFETLNGFEALTAVEGALEVEWEKGTKLVKAGETIVVPASLNKYRVKGIAKFLKANVP
jgi:mannose-6-phosphate isomerase